MAAPKVIMQLGLVGAFEFTDLLASKCPHGSGQGSASHKTSVTYVIDVLCCLLEYKANKTNFI
jgi:hypothetical protein